MAAPFGLASLTADAPRRVIPGRVRGYGRASEVHELDPTLVVSNVRTIESALAESLARERISALISTSFGVGGLPRRARRAAHGAPTGVRSGADRTRLVAIGTALRTGSGKEDLPVRRGEVTRIERPVSAGAREYHR